MGTRAACAGNEAGRGVRGLVGGGASALEESATDLCVPRSEERAWGN